MNCTSKNNTADITIMATCTGQEFEVEQPSKFNDAVDDQMEGKEEKGREKTGKERQPARPPLKKNESIAQPTCMYNLLWYQHIMSTSY